VFTFAPERARCSVQFVAISTVLSV
jgi:hypothetical protein